MIGEDLSDEISFVQELARQYDVDWERVFSLARRYNVFPRVWSNICLHGTKHGWSQLDLMACLAEFDKGPFNG